MKKAMMCAALLGACGVVSAGKTKPMKEYGPFTYIGKTKTTIDHAVNKLDVLEVINGKESVTVDGPIVTITQLKPGKYKTKLSSVKLNSGFYTGSGEKWDWSQVNADSFEILGFKGTTLVVKFEINSKDGKTVYTRVYAYKLKKGKPADPIGSTTNIVGYIKGSSDGRKIWIETLKDESKALVEVREFNTKLNGLFKKKVKEVFAKKSFTATSKIDGKYEDTVILPSDKSVYHYVESTKDDGELQIEAYK